MSYGIDVPITISMKLGVHNSYIIVGINSNVEINALTWTIGQSIPRKTVLLDMGKSIILYFLRSEVPYEFIDTNVCKSFIGSDILDYVPTMTNLRSITNQQDLSKVMGGFAVISAVAVIGIAIANKMS